MCSRGPFQYKCTLTGAGITIIQIRWSPNCLIFIKEIPIAGRQSLHWNSPWLSMLVPLDVGSLAGNPLWDQCQIWPAYQLTQQLKYTTRKRHLLELIIRPDSSCSVYGALWAIVVAGSVWLVQLRVYFTDHLDSCMARGYQGQVHFNNTRWNQWVSILTQSRRWL